MKILVVDDSSTMRRILVNCLAKMNLNDVTQASDGIEALKILGEKGAFDLCLTDWNMPQMSGLDLLKEIKSDAKLQNMPVVMVTTEAEKERIVEAVRCGAVNYIVKPFTPEILQEKLKAFLTGATA
jgi:two-component system, chemotaxis family, chemotaxis protein CheY